MTITRITSVKNPLVARFRDAAAGRRRGEMVADGVTLVADALESGVSVREVVISPRLSESARGRALAERLAAGGHPRVECGDAVLARLSHLTTHQGVAAIVERPAHDLDTLLTAERALLAVAGGIRDPGNLGAIVRTAEAADATGVVALAGGADPFRDKAVRGSAGSVLRMPVVGDVDPAVFGERAARAGVRLVVADVGAALDYCAADLRGPAAIAFGAETGGAPAMLRGRADLAVRIPMAGRVESLNVAVAAGVLLFEARRQRR